MSRIGAVLLLTLALAGCTTTEPAAPTTGVDYFDVPAGATPPGSHPTGRNPLTVPFEETR